MFLFDEIFLKLFNMSVTASWLILAVLIARALMKKAPKWINCTLWALVGIRLVNPFSFESIMSLIPSTETITSENFYYSSAPTISSGVETFNRAVNPVISESLAPTQGASVNPTQILGFALGVVWLAGVILMVCYVLISYLRLKKTVSTSMPLKENQYICDEVKTPFILGFIRPKIYLPSGVDEETTNYVIAHEKAHLKRKDHLWKPIGFLLLSVYWFNPLMWLSYILLCRDIELACDEKVIKQMEGNDKKAYSEALLSCSAPQKMITACPVAFGEVGVKQRIKSVLDYKKPAFRMIAVAVIASIVVAVCFLTDPVDTSSENESNPFSEENFSEEEPVSANGEDGSFTWTCNPMAGATWWYTVIFTVPEDYEIKSAEATVGSATVESIAYNEPNGEKCVEWMPDFNEDIMDDDSIITVVAEKDGEETSFNIRVRLFGVDNENGTKEYIIEPDNCKLTEKGTASYMIEPSPIEDLDTAVSQAILSINSGKNWLGCCPAEGHVILGKKESKNTTKVYVLERFSSYGFENGWFIEVGGHSTACVMTFVNIDGGYVFQDVEYTEDGANLDDSIKRMFPKHLQKRAMSPTDEDSRSMDEQCEKYAKAYLEEMGREAKIGDYGDVPRICLTDLGVSVEVSNKLLEMKGVTNACEVGYYEQDGATYSTLYCEEEKIIIYTKELYEKGIVETTAIEATTGEEVPFRDEYLKTAKCYEDYISGNTETTEKEYTTVAVSAEASRKITDLDETLDLKNVNTYTLIVDSELKFKTQSKEEVDETTQLLMELRFSDGYYAHYSEEDLNDLTEYQIDVSYNQSAKGAVICFDKHCSQMWFVAEDGSYSSSHGVLNGDIIKDFFDELK